MSERGEAIRNRLEAEARALGFHALGVASIPLPLRREYYRRWLAEGQHGTMRWMERNNERRLYPERLLGDSEARSLIVVALNYYQSDPDRGYRIAKYALGDDYHGFLFKRLKKLCRILREDYGGVQRPYVDTGPILEKPVAAAAGLGWQGKSTILIEPSRGTWSFLGAIVTTLKLPAGRPVRDRCGTCTRCMDVCPTGAIPAPYRLDASKCISYLTIEHQGPIPEAYRGAIGDRLFGCDECLDVCPWNKWAVRTEEGRVSARELPSAGEMLDWDETIFGERMRGSPLKRLKLSRFKRNLSVVLGNTGGKADLEGLGKLAAGSDAMVAEHADWAIHRIRARLDAGSSR